MGKKEKDYLPKVKILRERLCIGLQDGIDLLKQTEGDIEKASSIFKEKILSITLSVIKLPSEKVKPYLEKYKYDAGKAIEAMLDKYRLVDGVSQPEPVYILHKFSNSRKDAIGRIAKLITKKEKLSRNWHANTYEFPWLNAEALKSLDPFSLCVVALNEWLEFEDSESLDKALFYNLDLVAAQIQLLLLPDLAAALRMARDIYKELFDQYTSRSTEFYVALRKDEDFREILQYFTATRPKLIDKLYDFIRDNLDKFNLY